MYMNIIICFKTLYIYCGTQKKASTYVSQLYNV